MAKVIQMRGQGAAGWSKERWAWLRALTACGDLSPMARLVGQTLAVGFANSETAECRPSVAAIMKAVAASKSTVMRALADLADAGWIVRLGGESPSSVARYRFEPIPQRRGKPASEMTSERVSEMTPERVSEMTTERVSDLTRTGVISDRPPTPPYKEYPNMNQNPRPKYLPISTRRLLSKGPRPAPHLQAVVPYGSDAEEEWEEWLQAQGFPPLGQIGRRVENGMLSGWDMITARPPKNPEAFEWGLAVKFAQWLWK